MTKTRLTSTLLLATMVASVGSVVSGCAATSNTTSASSPSPTTATPSSSSTQFEEGVPTTTSTPTEQGSGEEGTGTEGTGGNTTKSTELRIPTSAEAYELAKHPYEHIGERYTLYVQWGDLEQTSIGEELMYSQFNADGTRSKFSPKGLQPVGQYSDAWLRGQPDVHKVLWNIAKIDCTVTGAAENPTGDHSGIPVLQVDKFEVVDG